MILLQVYFFIKISHIGQRKRLPKNHLILNASSPQMYAPV